MAPDAELMVLLAGLHVLGFVSAALLLVLLFRTGPSSRWRPPDEDDDDGGNDRNARPRPSGPRGGGVPLPNADPARVRLRGPERLADHHRPSRRPAREPSRPRQPVA